MPMLAIGLMAACAPSGAHSFVLRHEMRGLGRSAACAMHDGPFTFPAVPDSPSPMRAPSLAASHSAAAGTSMSGQPPPEAKRSLAFSCPPEPFVPVASPCFPAVADEDEPQYVPPPRPKGLRSSTFEDLTELDMDVDAGLMGTAPAGRPGSPQPRSAADARAQATAQLSAVLAADSSPYSLRHAGLDGMVESMAATRDAGIPHGTASADKSGFSNVIKACEAIGPNFRWMRPRSVEGAFEKTREVMWAVFTLMHLAQHKAPSARRAARGYLQGEPSSALNDIYAHQRVMLDCDRHRCDLTVVGRIMRGLNAVYVRVWGDTALVVQNAKPIPRRVLLSMAAVLRERRMPKWSTGQHYMWLSLHLYECSTGERKNAIGLAMPGDTALRRLDLVWVDRAGQEVQMTQENIRAQRNGATLRGSAAAGKTDRFRITWGNRFQWFILDDADPLNFAQAWQQFELECPCPPSERAKWAAFGNNGGSAAYSVHTLDTHFHKILEVAVTAADAASRTFHDYRATIASALATARASGDSGIDNALIQTLCHWKTEESVMRYTHTSPADYGKYVRVATDTDAGTAVHKDAPVYDPFAVCAELNDISEKLLSRQSANKKARTVAEAKNVELPAAQSFTLCNSAQLVACTGKDSWGIVGSAMNVLNSTWDDGAGTSACTISAFIGVHEHPDGERLSSYVVTDAEGDHYAVSSAALRGSMTRTMAKKCKGTPKQV